MYSSLSQLASQKSVESAETIKENNILQLQEDISKKSIALHNLQSSVNTFCEAEKQFIETSSQYKKFFNNIKDIYSNNENSFENMNDLISKGHETNEVQDYNASQIETRSNYNLINKLAKELASMNDFQGLPTTLKEEDRKQIINQSNRTIEELKNSLENLIEEKIQHIDSIDDFKNLTDKDIAYIEDKNLMPNIISNIANKNFEKEFENIKNLKNIKNQIEKEALSVNEELDTFRENLKNVAKTLQEKNISNINVDQIFSEWQDSIIENASNSFFQIIQMHPKGDFHSMAKAMVVRKFISNNKNYDYSKMHNNISIINNHLKEIANTMKDFSTQEELQLYFPYTFDDFEKYTQHPKLAQTMEDFSEEYIPLEEKLRGQITNEKRALHDQVKKPLIERKFENFKSKQLDNGFEDVRYEEERITTIQKNNAIHDVKELINFSIPDGKEITENTKLSITQGVENNISSIKINPSLALTQNIEMNNEKFQKLSKIVTNINNEIAVKTKELEEKEGKLVSFGKKLLKKEIQDLNQELNVQNKIKDKTLNELTVLKSLETDIKNMLSNKEIRGSFKNYTVDLLQNFIDQEDFSIKEIQDFSNTLKKTPLDEDKETIFKEYQNLQAQLVQAIADENKRENPYGR